VTRDRDRGKLGRPSRAAAKKWQLVRRYEMYVTPWHPELAMVECASSLNLSRVVSASICDSDDSDLKRNRSAHGRGIRRFRVLVRLEAQLVGPRTHPDEDQQQARP
jgi:hypothetical protein